MSDSLKYFDPSSVGYESGTPWQYIFEDQNGNSAFPDSDSVPDDGSQQRAPPTGDHETMAMQTAASDAFDDGPIDPAIWLESSDVPWPSIEHHEPLRADANATRLSAQPIHHPSQRSIPSDSALPEQDAWQYHDPSGHLQDWSTHFHDASVQSSVSEQPQVRVYNGQRRAPIAHMQGPHTDSTPFNFGIDRDEQQTQSIARSDSYHQYVQTAQTDRYAHHASNDTQSGPHARFDAKDIFNHHIENEQYDLPRLPDQPYPQGYHFSDTSFTQIPSHDLHSAYNNQSFSPELSYIDLDSEYIPDQTFSPDIFSPTPGPSKFSPEPEDRSRSRNNKPRQARQRIKTPNPNVTVMKSSLPCVASGCGRPFRNRTHVLDLCNRCARKHDRRTAEAQPNNLDPAVPDLQAARRLIYPPQLARGPPIEPNGLREILSREDEFIQRFLDAVNSVVPGGEGGNLHSSSGGELTWEMRQQITLNQKLRMEGAEKKGEDGAYRRPLITARLRALFLETYQFHTGTQECFYAIGGNNAGYNPDCTLTFQERFDTICELLEKNKRMVMDVIEGRGVKSVVANPKGYNKRKVSNNLCNEDKKEIMGKGKARVGDEVGSEVLVGKKRRRRNGKEAGDDGEQGPSSKRPRRETTCRSAAASRGDVVQEDRAETELMDGLQHDGEEELLGDFDFGFAL